LTLSPAQALDICYGAGFRFGTGIIFMPAIGWAESRLVTDARGYNANGTVDRGWLQINSIHTDISDAACDDPVQAAQYAFDHLSNQGTSFSPWVAFGSGAYRGPEDLNLKLFTAVWAAKSNALSLASCRDSLASCQANLVACQASLDSCRATLSVTEDRYGMALDRISAAQADLAE
jgi:hypothetical protein